VDESILDELHRTNESETMPDCEQDELREAIQNLKSHKAPGEDDITPEMIRAAGEPAVKAFHQLHNRIYTEEQCPEDWGKAVIVPLHCSNYRSISLLSVPGKILSRVLQQRLKQYVESTLAEEQCGFELKGEQLIRSLS